ncbi:MAG: Dyp-type peroxidase [Acidimicrobiales bacterium]
MNASQPGIFAQGARHHYHLEFDLRSDSAAADIGEALVGLREPAVTSGGANLVVGFGPDLWRRLLPDDVPDDLRPFTPVGPPEGARAPSTQHDLWIWIHGVGPDLQLDMARAITRKMRSAATLAAEQPCFVYRDSRDLTGFIDGTENPPVEEAIDVAVVPDGQPGARGSFAMTMKWVHDLDAFHALGRQDQEDVFGRTRELSLEMEEDRKPPTSHIARVVIEEDGEELEIYRRSTPFGTVAESGLYFLAFSADPSRFDKMLRRMFGPAEDGLKDRLLDFSSPASGAYYFVPSLDSLDRVVPG